MISRRTVLRGLGTAVALPTLEAMSPMRALAMSPAKTPVRLAYLFVPNGMSMEHWRPAATGKLGELPELLRPLKGVQGKINVLSGLAQKYAEANGDGPGDHARSAAAWLTGVQPFKTAGSDIRVGLSADQLAAQTLGKDTKFASLELGCERGGLAGNCDSGYSCAYSSAISWRTASTPVAKEVNPWLVFERLFGSLDASDNAASRAIRAKQNASILDFVLEDAASLRNRLGAKDASKLDEYLVGVREIEQRLVKFEKDNQLAGAKAPTGVPSDFGEHIRLMGDMMILAFQSDMTRVCTFMFANEGSNRSYPMVGVNEGHHEISHHGRDAHKMEMKRQIDLFHMQQLAYILTKMNSIQEGTGTLLDNTLLVFGGGIGDGDRHNHDDLPILLAGSAGGAVRTGQHLTYNDRTPMTNLFLGMFDRAGINIDKFGDSTGKLNPLF